MTQPGADELPASVLSQRLLLSLAEQLKVPFTQIARQAELGVIDPASLDAASIATSAQGAIKLLDNYILGVKLSQEPGYVFDTEPVSVSSVLYDTAAELTPLAKVHGVTLDLKIDGRFTPVMAHRQALQAALVSVGYALIEALSSQESSQLRLQFSAHRCRYGVVAGVYCDLEHLSATTLRTGRQLHGIANQPMTQVSAFPGAGVFVAEAILQGMQTQLSTSRHHNLHGLGTILQPNSQLQLI